MTKESFELLLKKQNMYETLSKCVWRLFEKGSRKHD